MKHSVEELQDHQTPQKFDHSIAAGSQPGVVIDLCRAPLPPIEELLPSRHA